MSLKRLIGEVCYSTGAREGTVRGYIEVLTQAGLVGWSERRDRIWLVSNSPEGFYESDDSDAFPVELSRGQ